MDGMIPKSVMQRTPKVSSVLITSHGGEVLKICENDKQIIWVTSTDTLLNIHKRLNLGVRLFHVCTGFGFYKNCQTRGKIILSAYLHTE
jgi:hypothetical protein